MEYTHHKPSKLSYLIPKQAETTQMRYSIRKVATVGATSALIGTFALLGGSLAQADQVTETNAPVAEVAVSETPESAGTTVAASEVAEALASSEAPNSTVASTENSVVAVASVQSATASTESAAQAASEVVSTASETGSRHTSEEVTSTEAAHSEASPVTRIESPEVQNKLEQLQGQVQSVVAGAMTNDQILALTEEEIKALNKIDFKDTAIKGTGTSLTYRNLKDIVASFLKQDSKLAVPYFKADTIINMPAFNTVDAQTMEKEEIDVWDSWPVQDVESGVISNWNGYQLVISMAGAANKNSNHIYLLYSKYGDNDFTHWKNAGPIFGYNALEDDQQWSGSATVNSDGSIQLYYTKNDTSNGKLNWQQLASATMNLAVENDEVVIKSVENDHIIFGGDDYHYQSYPKFMSTFEDDHNGDGIPDRTDNYCLRDPHIIEDNGSRYLIFEANTGDENYQGEKQIFNWSNYGGDDAFNLKSFLNINNNKHLYNLASWANGAIGILKLDDNEKNPSVAEVYTPLVTSHMVTDEVERPSVVKMGDKYYLFTASRINKSTDAEGTIAAREAVGDDVVMLGFVSDSLRGEYRPLNGSGVVLTASVPADWRTSTYSYYAVPVEGSADTLLVTSYMTNRGGIAGAENKSTWAPSFLIKMNADDTTEVLPKMTTQGDWIWDDSSDTLVHVGDENTAKLPNEDFNVDYYAVAGYGLKPHTYPDVDAKTGIDVANGVVTTTGQNGKTDTSIDQGKTSDDTPVNPTTGDRSVPNQDGFVIPVKPEQEDSHSTDTNQAVDDQQPTVPTQTVESVAAQEVVPTQTVSAPPVVPYQEGGIQAPSAEASSEAAEKQANEEAENNGQESSSSTDASQQNANKPKVAAKLAETTQGSVNSDTASNHLLPILASIFAAIAALAGLGYGLVTGKIKFK